MALVVLALLSAHGAAIYFRFKSAKFAGLSEGLFALGTMIFGAGIWLVAQAYNIDEHYPNAFFVWGLGALILAWCLESSVQGMIAAVIFTIWCGMETFDFRAPQHFVVLILLFGIISLAWKKRSVYLLGVSISALLLCILFNGSLFPKNFEVIFASLGALMIALSILSMRSQKFPESSPVFAFFGQATYWVVLFILTFPSACEELLYGHDLDWKNFVEMAYMVVCLASALVAWAFIFLPVRRFKSFYGGALRADHLLVPVSLAAISFNFGMLASHDGKPGSLLFNAIYLFQCIYLINNGCKNSRAVHAIFGTFLLACLAFARYADLLFRSLLSRAIVFLIVGAAIFFIGVRYMKNKERATLSEGKSL